MTVTYIGFSESLFRTSSETLGADQKVKEAFYSTDISNRTCMHLRSSAMTGSSRGDSFESFRKKPFFTDVCRDVYIKSAR